MPPRLVSDDPPYVSVYVRVRRTFDRFDALIDTGFGGDVSVPENFLPAAEPPNGVLPVQLADGSVSSRNFYRGTIELENLGIFPVLVIPLGTQCLVGRGVIDRFRITLDHGRQLIIEP